MKINSLQVLRGGAAWLVVYHHFMQMFYDFKSENLIGQIFIQRGNLGVDIFFVLSGFVMYLSASRSTVSGITFFYKRLFRVFPAYWFYTLVLLVFSYIFTEQFSYTSFTVGSILCSLSFIPHENPAGIGVIPFLTVGWTLNLEVAFYTVLSLCILFNRARAIILCTLIILSLPIVLELVNIDAVAFHALKNPMMWQFICGFFVAFLHSKFRFSSKVSVLLGTTLIVLSLIVITGVFGYGFIHKTIAATLTVIGFLLVDELFNKKTWLVRALIKLGDYSYSTYLSHILVLGMFSYLFGNSSTIGSEVGVVVVVSIAVYLVSALSFKYVEGSNLVLSLRDKLINAHSAANKKVQADA